MDKAERETIRTRCDAATSGPWIVDKCGRFSDHDECYVVMGDETVECFSYENADFIAHARQDIPALLDALDESEKECADAKAERDRWKARFEVLKTILKNRNPADLCRLCVNLKTFDDSCSDCMCISGLLDKFELDDAFLKKGDGQS